MDAGVNEACAAEAHVAATSLVKHMFAQIVCQVLFSKYRTAAARLLCLGLDV